MIADLFVINIFLLAVMLLSSVSLSLASTNIRGTLSIYRTWAVAGSSDFLTAAEDVTLSIEPSVVINRVCANKKLAVEGTLVAAEHG